MTVVPIYATSKTHQTFHEPDGDVLVNAEFACMTTTEVGQRMADVALVAAFRVLIGPNFALGDSFDRIGECVVDSKRFKFLRTAGAFSLLLFLILIQTFQTKSMTTGQRLRRMYTRVEGRFTNFAAGQNIPE